MREVALAPDIHMVQVRDDIVVLDVAADRYSCLVGGGAMLSLPAPGVVAAEEELLPEIRSAGFITDAIGAPPRSTPIPPQRDLWLGDAPGALACMDTAIRTLAATVAFQKQSLSQLVRPAARRVSQNPAVDVGRVARRTAAYRATLPWLPYEGVCLQRAWQLRQVLAMDGLHTDWVFGVKTWPFFAHCWLQTGDLVIADRIERVRSFTPIAVF